MNLCSLCEATICVRMNLINYVFSYIEKNEQFCLRCLAKNHNKTMIEIFDMAKHFINNKQCDTKIWNEQISQTNCPLKEDCVFQKCWQLST